MDIISKIGCAFSVASLCLTLVIFLLSRYITLHVFILIFQFVKKKYLRTFTDFSHLAIMSIVFLSNFQTNLLHLHRRLRQTIPRKILIHLCISLLCLYLVFLIGIDLKSGPMCLVAAGFLHYFVLTSVFWMGVEARNMYINLVTVFEVSGSTFLRKAACIAWGSYSFFVHVLFFSVRYSGNLITKLNL